MGSIHTNEKPPARQPLEPDCVSSSRDTATEFRVARSHRTDHSSPVRWIASHAARHWWLILVALVGAFGNAALAGFVPVLTGRAFGVIAGGATDVGRLLLRIALLIAISQLARAVLQLGRNAASELLGQRLERDIRDELYASLLGKDMTFHARQPIGDTMARATNDVREVNLMFNPGLNLVVGSANFLVMPLLLAPRYDWQLAATPAAFIALYAWALRRYLANLAPITETARDAFGRLNARLAEDIDGVEVVKGAAQEPVEIAGFAARAGDYRSAFVRQGEQQARFLPLLLLGVANAAGLLHSMWLFGLGRLGVGDVVAYMGLLALFTFPTNVSLFAYSQVSTGMASARRILDLITRRTDLDANDCGFRGPVRGHIELDHVDFAYGTGRQVIDDVSVRIAAGQMVAVVGQTGAGKTTIARLLNRTYDVTRGSVRVDGVDVRDWRLADLRRGIAIIEQDIFLFSRTVAENIAFGQPDASRDAIESAARAAQAHEFILQLPEGYDTVIGERGVTLSGGQRQRLAIARALLGDPRVLLIDDATSAVDSATEDRIQIAIRQAAAGRTTILISHRLSQVKLADQILVLRQGAVAACGTHEHLMAGSDYYRRLFVRPKLADRQGGETGGA